MTEKELILKLATDARTTKTWLNEEFGFSISELSEAETEKEFSQIVETLREMIENRMARLYRLRTAVMKLNYAEIGRKRLSI